MTQAGEDHNLRKSTFEGKKNPLLPSIQKNHDWPPKGS